MARIELSKMTEESSREIWRDADAVCFDVDSTVIKIEGIDELAAFLGVAEEVKAWTQRAMGGAVAFQDALKARLDICKPSKKKIVEFNSKHAIEDLLTPAVDHLVKLLMSMNKHVYLVSGGFANLIAPLADHLGIPQDRVYANRLLFDSAGEFTGFDTTQPTCRSGGKGKVVGLVKNTMSKVVMIGDGATDMEAAPPADTFIGFGGNVVREKVKAGAPWFVYNFQELIEELVIPTAAGMVKSKRMALEYVNSMERERKDQKLQEE